MFPAKKKRIIQRQTITPTTHPTRIIMTLRDHPLMRRASGFDSWPPIWTTTRNDPHDTPRGEIGHLKDVLKSPVDDYSLFLIIDYQGHRYMGATSFDNPAFCRGIYTLLKSHIGFSIKEIGDLDLSQIL
jgi:hypothetical protein